MAQQQTQEIETTQYEQYNTYQPQPMQFGLQMPQLGGGFQQPAAFSTQFQPMTFEAPQLQTTGSFIGFPNQQGGQPNFVFYPEFKETESSEEALAPTTLKTRDAAITKKKKNAKANAGACGCF